MVVPLRVGVVGVGHLGFHHARLYSEILGVHLAGVVDVNEDRAMTTSHALGVPYFTDLQEFINKCHPHALSIVVPTSLHFSISKIALENGIHVLIEKPVTSTVEEAAELLTLAEKRNLLLQVGHVERFNSAVQHVSSIVNKPMLLQSRRVGPFSPRVSDVGVVLDLMIHDIDIVLSLVPSEIVNISALGRSVCSDHEDIASAHLQFADGTIADILVSRVSQRRLRRLEIMEAERTIAVNYETQDVSIHRCMRENGQGLVEIVEQPIFPKKEPLKLELQHFVSCVREGRQPLVGIGDGKRALEVAVAVLRQISLNRSNVIEQCVV